MSSRGSTYNDVLNAPSQPKRPGTPATSSRRVTIERLTTDQLTREQKAASPFFENFWDSRGWSRALGISSSPQPMICWRLAR